MNDTNTTNTEETSKPNENFNVWRYIGTFIGILVAIIQAFCWCFLCYRNKKQRRLRAEKRAQNLQNQPNVPNSNYGIQNSDQGQGPWYTSNSAHCKNISHTSLI